MAQNGQILLSICRSCRRQLQSSSKNSRAFTSTPRHQKSIPIFTPTANNELDDLFLTFREKVFMPWALAKNHRELLYKKSRHQILTNDPGVTVTLSDGEEVKLAPMNAFEKPAKHTSLLRISELLGTSNDSKRWNNLPAFLEGMQMAKEELPEGWLEKMVRKANQGGKTGVIIRCAEMVKKTGFSLSDPALTKELMVGIHNAAADSGWDVGAVELAARRAEQVVLMLDGIEHCGGKLKKGHKDMRKDLTVLGTLLEMEAAKAVYVETSEEVTRKISDCITALLFIWRDSGIESGGDTNHDLVNLLPLLNGTRLALKVEGVSSEEESKELETRLKELESLAEKMRNEVIEAAQEKPRRSLLMYDRLVKE